MLPSSVKEQKSTEEESPSTVHTISASKTTTSSSKDHMIEISGRSMDI